MKVRYLKQINIKISKRFIQFMHRAKESQKREQLEKERQKFADESKWTLSSGSGSGADTKARKSRSR